MAGLRKALEVVAINLIPIVGLPDRVCPG